MYLIDRYEHLGGPRAWRVIDNDDSNMTILASGLTKMEAVILLHFLNGGEADKGLIATIIEREME